MRKYQETKTKFSAEISWKNFFYGETRKIKSPIDF